VVLFGRSCGCELLTVLKCEKKENRANIVCERKRVSLSTQPGGPEINESDYVWCLHLNNVFRRNYLPIIMGKTHARRDNRDSGNIILSQ